MAADGRFGVRQKDIGNSIEMDVDRGFRHLGVHDGLLVQDDEAQGPQTDHRIRSGGGAKRRAIDHEVGKRGRTEAGRRHGIAIGLAV